jgi:hypothetical protein
MDLLRFLNKEQIEKYKMDALFRKSIDSIEFSGDKEVSILYIIEQLCDIISTESLTKLK